MHILCENNIPQRTAGSRLALRLLIAGIVLVVFLAGIFVLVNKVLKIPRGFVTSCCGGGGIFSSEEYKKRKKLERSPAELKTKKSGSSV